MYPHPCSYTCVHIPIHMMDISYVYIYIYIYIYIPQTTLAFEGILLVVCRIAFVTQDCPSPGYLSQGT